MAKQVLKILDDLSPSEIKLRDLPRKPDGLYNMHFNEYGQLIKRAGYTEYNGTSLGSGKILGMHRFYNFIMEKEFLIAWGTSLYKSPDTGNHNLVALTNCPTLVADSDTYFYDFYNHCYILNGANTMMKYDRTNVRTVGITSPSAIPTGTNHASGGSLSAGAYKVCFTFVDEDGWESNASPVSTAIDADANDKITMVIFTGNIGTVTFTGSGLNDATSGGLYTGTADINYKIQIDAGDPTDPNTFKWSDDDGSTWTENVTITGSAQSLSNGVTITFGATTGHTLNEYWTFTVTVDPKVTKRRIYRTIADGAIYYYDKEVANNTAISVDLTQADSTLGQATVLHTDHTAPPDAPHLGTKRRSRAYIAKNDIVYISNLAEPEYFPLITGQYIWTGNRQKVTGLLEQLTGLPVFTDDSIERLLGTNRDNFEFKNSYATEGNIAPRSLVNCDNLLVYLEFDGIHYFDGVSTGIFSEALNEYIKTNINRTYAHLSCATCYDDKYLLCYPKGDSTTPSETIYLDLKNRTYGIYSFDFSCFSLWNRGTDGLQLYGGSNTIGRVYKIFDSLDDAGANITAYDSPEPIDLGLPEVYKQWYSIFVKVKTTSGTALAMYYTLDNNTETSSKMVSRDDIAFVDGGASADTITTVAGDFVAAGFVAGDILVVTGTDSNNKNMTIVSVVAKTITLATGIVTAEAAGDAILTKAKVLTANTTKWYRISLGTGGKRARTLKPRHYMSDKFSFEIHGYMICYEIEPFAEEKE